MCNILSLSATPGRLNDLLMNEIMDVKSVTYLVRLNHFLILNFSLSLLQCSNCGAKDCDGATKEARTCNKYECYGKGNVSNVK